MRMAPATGALHEHAPEGSEAPAERFTFEFIFRLRKDERRSKASESAELESGPEWQ